MQWTLSISHYSWSCLGKSPRTEPRAAETDTMTFSECSCMLQKSNPIKALPIWHHDHVRNCESTELRKQYCTLYMYMDFVITHERTHVRSRGVMNYNEISLNILNSHLEKCVQWTRKFREMGSWSVWHMYRKSRKSWGSSFINEVQTRALFQRRSLSRGAETGLRAKGKRTACPESPKAVTSAQL